MFTTTPVHTFACSDSPYQRHHVHLGAVATRLPFLRAYFERRRTADELLDVAAFPEFAPYDGSQRVTAKHLAALVAWVYAPPDDATALLACDPDPAHWELIANYMCSTDLANCVRTMRWQRKAEVAWKTTSTLFRAAGDVLQSGWQRFQGRSVFSATAVASVVIMAYTTIMRMVRLTQTLLTVIVVLCIALATMNAHSFADETIRVMNLYYAHEHEYVRRVVDAISNVEDPTQRQVLLLAAALEMREEGSPHEVGIMITRIMSPIAVIGEMFELFARIVLKSTYHALYTVDTAIQTSTCYMTKMLGMEQFNPNACVWDTSWIDAFRYTETSNPPMSDADSHCSTTRGVWASHHASKTQD